MIVISGRIFIMIKIDGIELPNSPHLVSKITMTEGMGALTPAIELMLDDYSGALNDQLALTDGNEILVTVGRTPEDANTQTRQYRLFGTKQKTSATGPMVQAIGIYDAPEYVSKSVRESFEANTQDVLAAIAARCKLKFKKGDGVAEDKQIWLNVCKSRAMFVQDTMRHGRIDDKSAMVAMLTSLGELRYYNASELIETPKEKIKHMFIHNTEESRDSDVKVYEVSQASDKSTAGVMNTWQNYGAIRVAHSLEGEFEKFDKLDITTASGFLSINSQVKKTIEYSRIDYSPLDCGNTHKNYWKALYQNVRLLALFSEHVSILTKDVTDVELLDVVIYRAANAAPKKPINKSDIYIVIGKTIMVKNGASYAERIELVRRSLSVKGESKLAGDTETTSINAAASSPIPDSMIDPTVLPSQSTMPRMNVISTQVAACDASMSAMKARIPDHTNAISFTLPSLTRVTEALAAALPAQEIVQRLGQLVPSLNHYKAMSGGFNTSLLNTLDPLTLLNTQLNNIPGVSAGIRQATLTNPSGILSSMTSAMMPIGHQQSMATILHSLVAQVKPLTDGLNAVPGGKQVQRALINHANDASNAARASSTTLSRMWNLNLSTMIGQQVPQLIKTPPSGSAVQRLFDTQYSPGAITTVPLSFDKQTSRVTQVLSTLTDTKQPQWAVEEALPILTVVTPEGILNNLGNDIEQSRRREQDMYPADWRGA